jgi:hypothetical protein
MDAERLKPEIGNRKSENRNRKPEIGNRKPVIVKTEIPGCASVYFFI